MQHFMYKAYHCWYQMEKGKNGHYVIMITIELQFLANKAFFDSLADLKSFSFMFSTIRFFLKLNKYDIGEL